MTEDSSSYVAPNEPPSNAHCIVTKHVFPPIAFRCFDWCAYWDGHEESGPYGWGRTEADAIADLEENYEEPLT